MPNIEILGLRTLNQQKRNVSSFQLQEDALSLTMDIRASADLLTPEYEDIPLFDAVFQVIDPWTNVVLVNELWRSQPFVWGDNL